MVVVVGPEDVERSVAIAEAAGTRAVHLGQVVAGKGVTFEAGPRR
jgi:selenophosphate synthetase-related protein